MYSRYAHFESAYPTMTLICRKCQFLYKKEGSEGMAYRDLNTHLRERFGTKVYKISLSTPFTCPNRDGTVGFGGCIFCSGAGSGNFAAMSALPIKHQLSEAKARVKKKAGADPRYVAYFQSFSSTYGDLDTQKRLYRRCFRS